mmetsp:Transcript_7330/g.10694  ORF Transcript_7330/g.10694 Transcript_7330/m.10694 type:complete len:80 (+) Transcript_7330:199-438(+)
MVSLDPIIIHTSRGFSDDIALVSISISNSGNKRLDHTSDLLFGQNLAILNSIQYKYGILRPFGMYPNHSIDTNAYFKGY